MKKWIYAIGVIVVLVYFCGGNSEEYSSSSSSTTESSAPKSGKCKHCGKYTSNLHPDGLCDDCCYSLASDAVIKEQMKKARSVPVRRWNE